MFYKCFKINFIVFCCLIIQIETANLNCKNNQETIKSFYVESPVFLGKGTTLKCLFGFTGKLVNLKWYVNESEFYRYEPTDGSRNHVKLFKVKGVKIDESQTQFDPTKGSIIRLTNLTYSSNGIYKCEVTTEPCFLTVEKKKKLLVIPNRKKGYFDRFGLSTNGMSNKLIINSYYLIILLVNSSRLYLGSNKIT